MAKKLKGVKRINRIINEFTWRNFRVKAVFHNEFLALCDEKVIGYTLAIDKGNLDYFIEDAEKRYPNIKADPFLWLFMHEIGHCMTDGMWTQAELERFAEQKEKMTEVEDEGFLLEIKNDWYHSVPDEFFATKWAGEYMEKHPKKIAKFWNKLQPEIMKFYIINGLFE